MLKNVEIKKVVKSNVEIKSMFEKSFKSDLKLVKKALKSVQSQKCNWNKKKHHPNYDTSLKQVLLEEQSLKNIITFFSETKTKSFEMTLEDVKVLNEAETLKMIKNIQSQKCLKQYEDDLTDYNKCLEVESMLFEHKKQVAAVPEHLIKKSDIKQLINDLEQKETLNKKEALEMLRGLL